MSLRTLLKTGMTVRQLIEELECHDPDAVVVYATSYGDYHSTTQALHVQMVESGEDRREGLAESSYSNSGVALVEDDEGELDWPVVVLS